MKFEYERQLTKGWLCDFFLPQLDVYIEYWGLDDPIYKINRAKKEEYYRKNQLRLISLDEADITHLDDVLRLKLEEVGSRKAQPPLAPPPVVSRRNIIIVAVVVIVALTASATAVSFYPTLLQSPIGTTAPHTSPTEIRVTSVSISCRGNAKCWEGTVTRVIDGDTLEVDSIRIRLALVDTPEPTQSGGIAAMEFTLQLCPVGSKALVDQDDNQPTDSFGRMLAVVWCSGKNLNAELLNAGLGRIDTRFCGQSEFRDEEWTKKFGC